MGISTVIQIPENIKQLQRFLDQCLSSDSPDADFIESLITLAQFKGENLEVVKRKIVIAGEKLSLIINLQRQFCKYVTQVNRFFQNSHSVKLSKNHQISTSNLDIYACDFEKEMNDLLNHDLYETVCKRNLLMAEYFDLYWDYSLNEVKDYLINLFKLESEVKNRIFANQELNDSYLASFSLVEIAAAKILQSDNITPQLRIPQTVDQKSGTTIFTEQNYPKDTVKMYNLEELLENVTPENYHEETNWGEVVGNEIW